MTTSKFFNLHCSQKPVDGDRPAGNEARNQTRDLLQTVTPRRIAYTLNNMEIIVKISEEMMLAFILGV